MPSFRQGIWIVATVSAVACPPANAEPEAFRGEVRIVSPSLDLKAPRRLQGGIVKEGGKWRLNTAPGGQQSASGEIAFEVDKANRKAERINRETGSRTALDFGRLETVKWSEIPQAGDSLAAFFTVGSALKQKAHFIRNTTFQRHPVQEYSFTEDKETFGRLFYSVEYGIPLKIDVFGARGTHALIVVENVRR